MGILLKLLLNGRSSYMKITSFRGRAYRISIEPFVQAGELKEDLALLASK